MANNRTTNPTPEEIAAACAEIQAGWTPAERLSRLRADWRPTFMRCDGVRQGIDSESYDGHVERHELLQAAETT